MSDIYWLAGIFGAPGVALVVVSEVNRHRRAARRAFVPWAIMRPPTRELAASVDSPVEVIHIGHPVPRPAVAHTQMALPSGMSDILGFRERTAAMPEPDKLTDTQPFDLATARAAVRAYGAEPIDTRLTDTGTFAAVTDAPCNDEHSRWPVNPGGNVTSLAADVKDVPANDEPPLFAELEGELGVPPLDETDWTATKSGFWSIVPTGGQPTVPWSIALTGEQAKVPTGSTRVSRKVKKRARKGGRR